MATEAAASLATFQRKIPLYLLALTDDVVSGLDLSSVRWPPAAPTQDRRD
jgi:hypothetical protein